MTRGGINFTATNSDGVLLSDSDRLENMLHGGEHFEDVNERLVHRFVARFFRNSSISPRQDLMDKLITLGVSNRPTPMGSTTTNN